jgi:hypothetical protein
MWIVEVDANIGGCSGNYDYSNDLAAADAASYSAALNAITVDQGFDDMAAAQF